MACKHLIFGNGYFGKRFNGFFSESCISEARIFGKQDVAAEIEKHKPKFVINCIGKTGRPNIDWCEDHKMETMQGNVTVPLLIVEACQEAGVKMVQLGSGCIYEGDNGGKGFGEEDEPNFFGSFYSRTKRLSEKTLKEFDVLQIRLRMPIDSEPNPRNLIEKLLKYNKIISVPNSISVVGDTLRITKELMEKGETGIFNAVNKGTINHEEILNIYSEASGKKHEFEVISLNDLDGITKAGRSNCVLSTKKLENIGIEVPEVKGAVKKCLTEYVENVTKAGLKPTGEKTSSENVGCGCD